MHTDSMARQRGAALITALIFLIIITMLSLSSMRSSLLELRQASNDEIRVAAFESAQGIVDSVIDTPANMPVVGDVGYRICTSNLTDCDQTTVTLPDGLYEAEVAADQVSVGVTRLAPLYRPPPRGLGTSARLLTAVAFQIDSEYDRADEGFGHSAISQGVLIVIPKGQ